MHFLLAAIWAAASASPPPTRVVQQARATIVVLQPYQASVRTWDPVSSPNQREVLKIEPDGKVVRLRLTEFE
ncbi:MAG TPA: hypothetical protein VFO45_08175 [Sphingomicrobium sp.]|nr:hypothetical protein [Sphingomicrobium sp.]